MESNFLMRRLYFCFFFHLFSGFVVGGAIWMRSCVMSPLNRSWWWKQWKRNGFACVSVCVCVKKSRCMCVCARGRERKSVREFAKSEKNDGWRRQWMMAIRFSAKSFVCTCLFVFFSHSHSQSNSHHFVYLFFNNEQTIKSIFITWYVILFEVCRMCA